MIDPLSLFLIVGVLVAGIIKRSEMALWLMLITVFGLLVSTSNSSPDALIAFFCGANLILMLVGFENWRRTGLSLPFFIAVLACFDVVAGFAHYIHLLNIGSTSLVVGLVSGTIGYIQLMLVIFMKDKKGVMNDLLNDCRDLLHGALHMGGNNNNSERSK